MFSKKERSTFPYWFAHWCAYQMTALNLKVWTPRFLLHDIEKPWLRLFWSYNRVSKWHKKHNAHHLAYHGKYDILGMIIDWECSRFTKESCKLNARQQWNGMKRSWREKDLLYYDNMFLMHPELNDIEPTLDKLGL